MKNVQGDNVRQVFYNNFLNDLSVIDNEKLSLFITIFRK